MLGARSGHAARSVRSLPIQLRETHPLLSLRIEILRRKPALERRLAGRPFGIEHGKPGGVAVAALVDLVLAEHAFEREAEAQGRPVRGTG